MKWPYSCTPLFIYDMTLFTIWPYLWYDLIYLRYDLIYDMTLFIYDLIYLWYDLIYDMTLFMKWPYSCTTLFIYDMTLFMYVDTCIGDNQVWSMNMKNIYLSMTVNSLIVIDILY